MELVRNYLIAFVVFFVIDILWLGFVAKDFYREQLGFIMATKTNWPAAIVFYLIFIGGLMFFAINPALAKDSIKYAFLVGGLFGFMTYATYDMTNLATLKDWPLVISIIDIIWGTLLNALTAGVSFYIINLFT
ncbi:MAG TPA: DUF2177 family protein [Erysipelotrichaceae bacterium]|nr:DUF2177 family protein [Erysipelotrichaceae bacterium]